MSRNLAIFLDGTWNSQDSNTNVWRLNCLCERNETQLVHYSKGVGTQFGQILSGGAFGFGLDQEVIDAYQWLVETYRPNDKVYIFGFSRGAYTARSLSGLIARCGLLELGSPLGVKEIYNRYRRGSSAQSIHALLKARIDNPTHALSFQEDWITKYSQPIAIHFIGVWDTVGALGIPVGDIPEFSTESYKFLDTDLMIENFAAYHALAIDEHRHTFSPTLWTKTESTALGAQNNADRDKDMVEQRWFVGAHANVGGGYESDILATLPLDWIKGKAIDHGLKFITMEQVEGDTSMAPVADSYAQFGLLYRIVSDRYYRPLGQQPVQVGETVVKVINETIDGSVFARWRENPTYRPQNLVNWANKHRIDPAIFTVTANASDATPYDSVITAPGQGQVAPLNV